MARIRTIKPEFWRDEDLSELPPEVHLLAAALLNYADDEGYFNANPKLVAAECCPLREDSVSTHGALKMLRKTGYIRVGNGDDGKTYGQILNFKKHQRINRPSDSKISEKSITWEQFTEDSVNNHGTSNDRSHPEGNREHSARSPQAAPRRRMTRKWWRKCQRTKTKRLARPSRLQRKWSTSGPSCTRQST